ncbi:MAG: hypothetical protein ACREJO_10365 [Phycisphaerales bacterium]
MLTNSTAFLMMLALAAACFICGCAQEPLHSADESDSFALRAPPDAAVGQWAEYRGDHGGNMWSLISVTGQDVRGLWIEYGQQTPGAAPMITAVAYRDGEPAEAYRGEAGCVGRPLRIAPLAPEEYLRRQQSLVEGAAESAGLAKEARSAQRSSDWKSVTRRELMKTSAGEFDCAVEEHTMKMLWLQGRITVWRSDRVPFGGMVRYSADYGVGPKEHDELVAFGEQGTPPRLRIPPR